MIGYLTPDLLKYLETTRVHTLPLKFLGRITCSSLIVDMGVLFGVTVAAIIESVYIWSSGLFEN